MRRFSGVLVFALRPERDTALAMATKGQGRPAEGTGCAKTLGQGGVWSVGHQRMTGWPELRDEGEVG